MDYHFRSPGDGLVTMDSLPEAEVHVRVSAAGFATQSFGPFNMPAAGNSEGFYLDLARAGHIQGRCVHRGAPVQNFDVTYWGKFSALRVTESFRNAPDGPSCWTPCLSATCTCSPPVMGWHHRKRSARTLQVHLHAIWRARTAPSWSWNSPVP